MKTSTKKSSRTGLPAADKLASITAIYLLTSLGITNHALADDDNRGGWYQQPEWRDSNEAWRNNDEGGRAGDGWRRNYNERRWDDDDWQDRDRYAQPVYPPPVIYYPQPQYQPPAQYYPQPYYPQYPPPIIYYPPE